MTKVYPNAASALPAKVFSDSSAAGKNLPVVLTVWKKSLLFNCDGFTVFDSKGDLVFRVDNYVSGSKGEIILMDAAGHSLLNIRRKRLSLSDNWTVYDGDTVENPRFTVTKHVNFLKSSSLAHVTATNGSPKNNKKNIIYEIEGSYAQRCCAVYDEKRWRVAEIKRKEAAVGGVAFGGDVFRLVVEPEIDPTVAMALVVLLDQMFDSSRRFSL